MKVDSNFVILCCIAALMVMIVFLDDQVCNIKKQAIERGHAEYVMDSDGKITWQWKEEE